MKGKQREVELGCRNLQLAPNENDDSSAQVSASETAESRTERSLGLSFSLDKFLRQVLGSTQFILLKNCSNKLRAK